MLCGAHRCDGYCVVVHQGKAKSKDKDKDHSHGHGHGHGVHDRDRDHHHHDREREGERKGLRDRERDRDRDRERDRDDGPGGGHGRPRLPAHIAGAVTSDDPKLSPRTGRGGAGRASHAKGYVHSALRVMLVCVSRVVVVVAPSPLPCGPFSPLRYHTLHPHPPLLCVLCRAGRRRAVAEHDNNDDEVAAKDRGDFGYQPSLPRDRSEPYHDTFLPRPPKRPLSRPRLAST